MRVTIIVNGTASLVHPLPEQPHAVAEGQCPNCRTSDHHPAIGENVRGYFVQGHQRRISADDCAYEADAFALCCATYVGLLRVDMPTLFGVKEDEAVCERARVYA